jgi:hypothetical protein
MLLAVLDLMVVAWPGNFSKHCSTNIPCAAAPAATGWLAGCHGVLHIFAAAAAGVLQASCVRRGCCAARLARRGAACRWLGVASGARCLLERLQQRQQSRQTSR